MAYTDQQKRQHIAELQRYLHTLEMKGGNGVTVIPDGVYGTVTSSAIKDFQNDHGLPATGDTDSATWNEVVKEYRNIMAREPIPYPVFPSADYVCKKGSTGTIVYVIQAILYELGNIYDNITGVDVCGNYTPATIKAVEEFQKKLGLPCTGEVDSMTWNSLLILCN